jgi:hypothetical protein
MTNHDKPAAPRRLLWFRAAWLTLLGALLVWHFWPRPAPVEVPSAPGWPSPLDVLDPTRLSDNAWPRKDRPAEAVGVLDLGPEGDDRLVASIADGIVLIKNARGEDVVRIADYAPPKPAGGVPPLNFDFVGPRDKHTANVAVLSPKADRLVVLGHTNHTAGTRFSAVLDDSDQDWSSDWAQVWRWEGSTLTPLEAQPLEGQGASAAVISSDGRLLATSNANVTDIWEIGDKKLEHLFKITGEKKQFLFAPDGHSLAVINPGSVALYDLSPILPGGWARWRLLWVACGLLAALGVFRLVSQPSEVARAQRWLPVVAEAAFLGVGACVAWWAWQPTPVGAPLTIGLGFAAALAVFVLLARACRRPSEPRATEYSKARRICLVTIVAAVVCLVLWGWQFWWPSLALRTPSDSDLASADIRSACFSADSSELAAVRPNGRLSLFNVATGAQTRTWSTPDGILRPEYAADGRHLLAVAEGKAYVFRLKPFDDAAYVLSCCEKVFERDPKSIDALLARGHVHLHRKELDEAIADFTEVIALDEKNAAAYHGRGLARTDKGDYAGARADFAAALRLDPKLAAAVSRRPPP